MEDEWGKKKIGKKERREGRRAWQGRWERWSRKKKKSWKRKCSRYTMWDEREIVNDWKWLYETRDKKMMKKRRWKWKKEELREILRNNKELNMKENELRYGKKVQGNNEEKKEKVTKKSAWNCY